jgi:ubiquitin C-terminal hydrolase
MGSLNGGHYVYFHKFDDNWTKFNDEIISSANEEDDIKKYGYIYLYEKM